MNEIWSNRPTRSASGQSFIFFRCSFWYLCRLDSVPHRNTGLPNLQESYVGTLFPRSVHNGPSSRIYNVYIHTVCVYSRVFFPIFWYFYGFLRFFRIFMDFFSFLFSFSFLFLFRFSLKKEWGVQFSRFPIVDKFS